MILLLENSKEGNTRFLLKMMREGLSFQAEFQLSFGDFWSFETVSITNFCREMALRSIVLSMM